MPSRRPAASSSKKPPASPDSTPRRHEAELKLRAAEQNLTRLDDVTAQLETQLNILKRQARQATKYKSLSAEIRRLEAMGLYVSWREAAEASERDAAALDEATRILPSTRALLRKLRLRDDLGEKLPSLREQEAIPRRGASSA